MIYQTVSWSFVWFRHFVSTSILKIKCLNIFMFLRENCIHNLHKIISHYLFHLLLCWKSQLKGNKLSCLFEGSLLGLLQLVQSTVSVQCWLLHGVICWNTSPNATAVIYHSRLIIPSSASHSHLHTRLICHGCIVTPYTTALH